MERRNSKLFLALLIAAYLFSAQLWGWRQGEPEPVSAERQSGEIRDLRPEPMGKFYSTNYPEDIPAEVLASVIEEYAHYMWPSALVTPDEWKMIAREHQRENVNPLWPSAIAAHESHLGAHRPAYEKGNLWGIDKSGTDASLSDLGSLQDGARYISQLLAQYYFDEGRLTFKTLEEKYASQIDPPNGVWAARVRYFFEDLAAELAQRVDPTAPSGIPVVEEDGPRFSGNPYYPVLEVRGAHRGVDIAANPGDVWLHSTIEGKVIFAGFIEDSCDFVITFTPLPDAGDCPVRAFDVTGWTVVVENERWQIILGHGAEEPAVKVGEVVSRGDRLMLMGDTGRAFGRHVHYGVRYKLPSGEWRFASP